MRIGFRYSNATGANTLWTTLRPGSPDPSAWGRISRVTFSFSDFEISEAKITFAAPSDDLVRAMLAICIAEATPLDLGLDALCGSIWVQDVRFGYDPLPIFYGNILEAKDNFAPGGRTLTVTLHDLKRLIHLQRDLQDYQNLTDSSIVQMLGLRLNEVLTQSEGVSLGEVVVDQEALQRVRQTSTGAIRQYNARNMGRMLRASELDKLRVSARALGFALRVETARNPQTPEEAYQKFTLTAIGGALEKPAGTYRLGDGEVISFTPGYTPPSPVLQRDTMNKRFNAVNETLQLENAQPCVELDEHNIVRTRTGEVLPRDAITMPSTLTNADGQPITLNEYQNTTRATFIDNIKTLGAGTTGNLWKYHDRIALRKGVTGPGLTPSPINQSSDTPASDYIGFNESSQETGELYWRFTGTLQTRFNPLLTTTDYLTLAGFGVWDGTWGIRSFSHDIGPDPTTTFQLTFGDAAKTS